MVSNPNSGSRQFKRIFLKSVSDILLRAKKSSKTAVNLSMVYAYEIGRMIVEEERHRESRAAYGA